jgi:DEAD/DEAH box helicase domain-containing protein
VDALNSIFSGNHTLIVSSTASGKTLCYTIPTIMALLEDRELNSLYLFPTKALAQDQLKGINELVSPDNKLKVLLRADTYDGDTPPHRRKNIRSTANVVITNPDMLHMGILPHHSMWASYFQNLKYVVIDEIHTYRGVFGSNVANLLKRLKRIANHYGSKPQFICASATIGNPKLHIQTLLDEDVDVIEDDGSPKGKRYVLLWQPPYIDKARNIKRSANVEAQRILTFFTREGVQTITFCRARVVAELIYRYAKEQLEATSKRLADSIKAYRGGYLPEERREIEQALFSGELLGVTSTNALELGIDVGSLDVSIIVGYPGTIASLWQQAGRAGRGINPSIVIFIPYEDPIDQFLIENPRYLFDVPFENAIIDPLNPYITLGHIKCASFELPLTIEELKVFGDYADKIVEIPAEEGKMKNLDDKWFWSSEEYPAADVNLRTGSQNTFNIIDTNSRDVIGTVDEESAYELVYPEAIYLHAGDTYFVRELDIEQKIAYVEKQDVDYYTQPQVETSIRLNETLEEKTFPGILGYGEVTASWSTVGFKKIRFYSMESIGWANLDLPIQKVETAGLYLSPGENILARVKEKNTNIYESLLGVKNALLSIIPLHSMCDPMDIGGVLDSSNLGVPAIFIYDKFPGGLGFSEKAFEDIQEVITATLDMVRSCPCEEGCPSCVGVITRGYGRHVDPDLSGGPLIPDKVGAILLLKLLKKEIED